MTFGELLADLSGHDPDAPLIFRTPDGEIRGGYHVTELRVAEIRGIDCGGRQAAWTESDLQLLDGSGGAHMTTGKFVAILAHSIKALDGLGEATARVEFGHGNARLSRFGLTTPREENGQVVISVQDDAALCKPMAEKAGACCTPKPAPVGEGQACCAA